MNENIHYVLDSVSAVQETDLMNDPRVHVVRLVVSHGKEEWHDGDKTLEEMVAMIEASGELPSTSQPPLGELLELLSDLTKKGKKVIFVTLSSGLSGTYQTACMAAKQVMSEIKSADIRVIDGKTCGAPLVGVAQAIMAKADAGCDDMDELERYGNDVVARTATYFSVADLEYLRKGGRIGKASAFIGGILGIRPILIMDKDGKVGVVDKCRSRKKVLKRLIELAASEGELEAIYVCDALCDEDAIAEEKQLQELYPGVPTMRTSIGTVLTAHLGPGVIGVFVRRKA